MNTRIEWYSVDATGEFPMPDDGQVIQIDWYYPEFTGRRVVQGVWIARPVDE